MNSAIANISNQLTSMSTAINSLCHPSTTNATQQLISEQHDRHAAQKSPIFQNAQQQSQGQYTEALKQRLLQEQEKTNQLEFAQNKLPSINTGRKSAPPDFCGLNRVVPQVTVRSPKHIPQAYFYSCLQHLPPAPSKFRSGLGWLC
jgi:hypothetical protein